MVGHRIDSFLSTHWCVLCQWDRVVAWWVIESILFCALTGVYCQCDKVVAWWVIESILFCALTGVYCQWDRVAHEVVTAYSL